MNNKTAEVETPSSISIILQMIRKPSSVIVTFTEPLNKEQIIVTPKIQQDGL